MAEADATELEAIKTLDAHSSGHTSAVWLATKTGLEAMTAGADGYLSDRQIRPSSNVKNRKFAAAVNDMNVNPAGTTAVVAVDNYAQLVDVSSLEPRRKLTVFSIAARCCCWSKDGQFVAMGSDDGVIKIFSISEKQNKAVLTVRIANDQPGFLRGLALDPDNKYLAATTAEGLLRLFDREHTPDSGAHAHCYKKSIAAQVDQTDTHKRQGLAWHPDGSLLAVAGRDSDVILLERYNWTPTSYLTGGHTGTVRVIAFSPNGLYAATAGDDCKVVVWLVDSKMQVASRKLPAPASSLSWHPSANLLLCATSGGAYGMWATVVPSEADSSLPSPYKAIDEVEKEADRAAAQAAAAAADEGGADDFDDAQFDDEGVGAVIQRRSIKRTGGDTADAAEAGDAFDELFDDLDAALEEAGHGPGHNTNPGPALYPSSLLLPKPKKPQAAIQPGCTPDGAGGGGGEGDEWRARFLAYNQLGAVVIKAGDGQNYLEVCFHDKAKHRLQPKLTDLFGFTAASLSARGVAYISPAAGEGRPSMLVYRIFESWCSDKGWSVVLPAGEEAAVVAAGSSCVAVATSNQLLRLYSLAGRQLSLLNIQGAPVALVAAGPVQPSSAAAGPAAATASHLAVVWARGGPEPLKNTQQLDYAVFDVTCSSQVYSGSVVLSPGSSLSWIAFSAEGVLTTMDSVGTLRVRSPDWGGCWVPVLDAAAAKSSCAAERLWPVSLSLQQSALTAVVTTSRTPHPQVLPPPVHTQVPLSLPLAPAEAAPAELEEEAVRMGLMEAQVRALASTGVSAAASVAAEVEVAADRASLKLFNEYLKADKQGRALELMDNMHADKTIQGALKLANHHHCSVLAEHIQAFLEERQEWELQQQAAAVQAQQQQQQLGDEAGWADAAAAGVAGVGVVGVGEDNDMVVQPDQASQFQAASSNPRPAAAPSIAQGTKVAHLFGGRAAAGGGSGSGSGGALKRKPTAAGLMAGPAGGKGGSTNPFARKKTK